MLGWIASVQASPTSELHQHPSPYLAMHANDPVEWHLWQPQTLDKAQQQNKLILLSSGYYACHWCHVMQAENYQNTTIATLLNQHFISIKIDRELTPEIDRFMIEFAREHLGSAGWPQHVILLPDGSPIAGFTYLPTADLQSYLEKLSTLWQQQPTSLKALAPSKTHDDSAVKLVAWSQIADEFREKLFTQLNQQIDDFSGGLKRTNKFPESPLLIALLQEPNLPENLEEWLHTTLNMMQSEHLFDHVNGGFYRYTVDPNWQTPHFEKMLYDQAQLLKVYALGYQRFQEHSYLKTIDATLGYLREQLYSEPMQLYLGSQSALDPQGNEGGSYLWTRQALRNTLNDQEYAQAEQDWKLNSSAPYEYGFHPKPTQKHWLSIQTKLKNARIKEIPKDDKAIVGWNALLLSAFNEIAKLPILPISAKDNSEHDFRHIQTIKEWQQPLVQSLKNHLLNPQAPRALVWKNQQTQPLNQATLEELVYGISALNPYLNAKEHSTLIAKLNTYQTQQGWKLSQSHLSQNTQTDFIDDAVASPTALAKCLLNRSVNPLLVSEELLKNPSKFASYLTLNRCSPIILTP